MFASMPGTASASAWRRSSSSRRAVSAAESAMACDRLQALDLDAGIHEIACVQQLAHLLEQLRVQFRVREAQFARGHLPGVATCCATSVSGIGTECVVLPPCSDLATSRIASSSRSRSVLASNPGSRRRKADRQSSSSRRSGFIG
jgi:hypothetical protein